MVKISHTAPEGSMPNDVAESLDIPEEFQYKPNSLPLDDDALLFRTQNLLFEPEDKQIIKPRKRIRAYTFFASSLNRARPIAIAETDAILLQLQRLNFTPEQCYRIVDKSSKESIQILLEIHHELANKLTNDQITKIVSYDLVTGGICLETVKNNWYALIALLSTSKNIVKISASKTNILGVIEFWHRLRFLDFSVADIIKSANSEGASIRFAIIVKHQDIILQHNPCRKKLSTFLTRATNRKLFDDNPHQCLQLLAASIKPLKKRQKSDTSSAEESETSARVEANTSLTSTGYSFFDTFTPHPRIEELSHYRIMAKR